MKRIAILSLCACLAGAASAALADDPDPLEIVKKADAATKAVKAVSYELKVWGEGGMEQQFPKIQARVSAKEHADAPLPYFRAEIKMQLPGSEDTQKSVIVIGEKSVMTVKGSDDQTLVFGFDEAQDRIGRIMPLVWMQEFLHPEPFTDEIKGELKHEGVKKIGDAECHVIYVAYDGGQGEARWYFGKEDSLPHRVDRIVEGGGSYTMELTKVNASPKFDDKIFEVRKLKVEPVEPSDKEDEDEPGEDEEESDD